jgi:acetyl esterase
MDEYVLDPSLKRILKKRRKLGIGDVTTAAEATIDAYNRSEFKSSVFRKLYRPKTKNIISRTFIIPVTDGAVTGYLFEKVKDKAIAGQNSLIVLFHDGGWMLGNMRKCNAVCSNICDATGASVLAIDYRLAPKFRFPIPLEDCYEAFIWAAQGARYWKVDPDKIYVMGNCAGGNLAAGVSRLARDRKGPKIAGQILFSPVTDGRMRTESYEKFKDCPTLPSRTMAFYIQNYSREPKDILDPLFSPLLAKDHSRLPETLIICGEYDPLLDDSQLYAQALSSADTPAKCLVSKGMIHSFIDFPELEAWKDCMYAVATFIGGRAVSGIELLSKSDRLKLERRPHLVVQ